MSTNKTILVVDDDSDIRQSVKALLDIKGYEVIEAENKDKAFQALANNKPDLLLLDVTMRTEQEGFEMVSELKYNKDYFQIPVIMVTSMEVMSTSAATAEFANELRKNSDLTDLKVLLIREPDGTTAIDYKSDKTGKSIFLQVKNFIPKPVDPAELYQKVERVLG